MNLGTHSNCFHASTESVRAPLGVVGNEGFVGKEGYALVGAIPSRADESNRPVGDFFDVDGVRRDEGANLLARKRRRPK